MQNSSDSPKVTLEKAIHQAVDRYFSQVGDYELADLYDLVIGESERVLMIYLWRYTRGNKSQMSRILGLSRATLIKKLAQIKEQLDETNSQ
jgi:DNA-binding protein Fis